MLLFSKLFGLIARVQRIDVAVDQREHPVLLAINGGGWLTNYVSLRLLSAMANQMQLVREKLQLLRVKVKLIAGGSCMQGFRPESRLPRGWEWKE